jgi:hypothetical protein
MEHLVTSSSLFLRTSNAKISRRTRAAFSRRFTHSRGECQATAVGADVELASVASKVVRTDVSGLTSRIGDSSWVIKCRPRPAPHIDMRSKARSA